MEDEINYEYCEYCGLDMKEKTTKNNFPPCEVCNKVFDLKTFNLCSENCTIKYLEFFLEENLCNCKSCNVKKCFCNCRWLHFNDKESCTCVSCVNNHDELLCEKCNNM